VWPGPLTPDLGFVFAVLGHDGVTARWRPPNTSADTPADDAFTAVAVDVVGDWHLDPPLTTTTEQSDETTENDVSWQRYDRSIRMLGVDGMQALADSHVATVGCGGLGSFLAAEAARMGVGELTLIDPDIVEASNLPRLVGARPGDIGRDKVAVMADQCRTANPDLGVHTYATPVEDVLADAIVSLLFGLGLGGLV